MQNIYQHLYSWEVGSEKLLGVGGRMNCIEWTINNLRLEKEGQQPVTWGTTKLLRPFGDFGTLYGGIYNSSAIIAFVTGMKRLEILSTPLWAYSLGGTEPLWVP